jgi:hypothetical protein
MTRTGVRGKAALALTGAALLAIILVALSHLIGQPPPRLSKTDLVGTWASVENPESQFIFHADGRASFQNIPSVLFDSGERSEDLHSRGQLFKRPYVSQSGTWMLYQPHENGVDVVRFEQPNGSGFDLNVDQDGGRPILSLGIGDPDYNVSVIFRGVVY